MTTFEILIALVVILSFVAVYFTTLREPIKFALQCAAYLLITCYLIGMLI